MTRQQKKEYPNIARLRELFKKKKLDPAPIEDFLHNSPQMMLEYLDHKISQEKDLENLLQQFISSAVAKN